MEHENPYRMVPPVDSLQLPYTCLNSMVYGRYNELVNGVYNQLITWGAPACIHGGLDGNIPGIFHCNV